jgi:hypothetical protein
LAEYAVGWLPRRPVEQPSAGSFLVFWPRVGVAGRKPPLGSISGEKGLIPMAGPHRDHQHALTHP